MNSIRDILEAAEKFRIESEKILGFSESSVHRVVGLSQSYSKLDKITTRQSDMLRQALRCIEVGVFRGAHVLAWASIADYLQRRAAQDGFCSLNAKYPKWNITSLESLRDTVGEHNLIEGLYAASLITKSEKKALLALLNKRNECAHPTDYYPDLNQSLGYVSECISRMSALIVRYGAEVESEPFDA